MTARMLLDNIAAFGLQVTVLVAVGAALSRAFRIDEPRAMLAYWRVLLLACLLLPLCQPWNIVIPPTLGTPAVATKAASVAAPAGSLVAAPSRPTVWPVVDVVLIVIAAGIATRLLWLTIGAFGLRRLRRDAAPLDPLPDCLVNAQERVGARAGIYVSDRVSGPITFGLLRPVVMFPPSVSTMPAHVQEAIVYHELLHVRRRDWLAEILEEAVRSLLWFHPAIWWLIGRIQLTREQVVDQAAIRLTDSRERYLESLLAVARASSPTSFTPASAFLRRHALKNRVARILQETTMTTRRLIASLAGSAAGLAVAATLAVQSFPLEAQGKAPAGTDDPVQVVRGGEHLLHGAMPGYPRRAEQQQVEGDVVVDMSLNEKGEVSDARVLSGPEELRKATLEAVLQWHYSPSALSSTMTQATLRFQLPPEAVENVVGELRSVNVAGELKPLDVEIMKRKVQDAYFKEVYDTELAQKTEGLKRLVVMGSIEVVADDEPMFDTALPLIDLRTERVSEATARAVLAQAGVRIGDAVTEEIAKRIQKIAVETDEHFRVDFQKEKGGLIVTILAR